MNSAAKPSSAHSEPSGAGRRPNAPQLHVQHDPLARAQRRTRATRACAITLVVAVGAWAFWPTVNAGDLERDTPAMTPNDRPNLYLQTPAKPLDLAAFDAALWIAPPAPVVATAAPPPAPPPALRAQLIAIASSIATSDATSASGASTTAATSAPNLAAIFYDPDADVLRTLRTGDRIDGRTINAIDRDGVTLSLGDTTQRLDLRPDSAKRHARGTALTAAQELALLMGKPLEPLAGTAHQGANSPAGRSSETAAPAAVTPTNTTTDVKAKHPATAPRGKGRRP